MRSPSVLRLLAALGFVAALTPACRVYPDSLLEPLAAGGGGNGGAGGGGGVAGNAGASGSAGSALVAKTGEGFWSGTGDNQCFSAKQPTLEMRPAPTDTTALAPIWMGINRLWLGSQRLDGTADPEAWADFGFDLDNSCTLSPTCDDERKTMACKPTGLATPPDGNDCRDNTFGNMQKFVSGNPTIGARYGLDDGSFNCGLCYGNFNILIRISGYNGTASDDQVRVDLFGSPGLEAPLVPTCEVDEKNRACWPADFPWTIQRSALADPTAEALTDDTNALTADPQAYVRDGYLIAHLPPSALVWFPGTIGTARTFPIKITNGLVSAHIGLSKTTGTWELSDAVLGGRVTQADVVQGFSWVGLCEGQDNFKLAMGYIKANLDVTADPNAPAGTTCDSISMGVAFKASQATPGKLVDGPTLVDCPPPLDGTGGAAGASGSAGTAGSAGAAGTAGAGQAGTAG